ncbi:MAG: ATP-binding protein [Solirubrobacterales bacterium]
MKISYKIALTHALMFLLLQIIICSILLYFIRIYYPIEATYQVQTLVDEISENVRLYNKPLDGLSKNEIVPAVSSKHKVYIIATDLNGNRLMEYGELNFHPGLTQPYNQIIRENKKNVHLIYCNSMIKTAKNQDILLQVSIDITQHLEFNTTLFKVLLILTVFGFVISIFTGFIASRIVLKPISKVIKTAQTINADNLNMRIETNNAKDELNELSITLNNMVDRLQDSFEKQEQLISDVSHELKTPISVIKGYTSLLERWGTEDPAIMQESITRIGKESEHMTKIVGDLLFLARKDKGSLHLDKIKFDMNELVDEIINETNIITGNCSVSSPENDICSYFGDYRLIKQLLRILIDNSIKYSIDKCKVMVYSIFEGNHLKMVVEDNGIGIPQDKIEKIFDRFYRVDKARTRNKGGCGLGLPIAKAIVEAHNGKIKAESELGKWTKIIIELPFA